MNKKDKLVTLATGKQYVIIEECDYNEKHYYFACEIINNDTTDNFKVFQLEIENGKESLITIDNDDIIKAVCKIIDDKTN